MRFYINRLWFLDKLSFNFCLPKYAAGGVVLWVVGEVWVLPVQYGLG